MWQPPPDVAIPKLSKLSRCRCNVEIQSMNRCGRFSYFYVPHCLRLAEKRQNANALTSGLEERDQYNNGDDSLAGESTIILLDKGATCIRIVSLRRLQTREKNSATTHAPVVARHMIARCLRTHSVPNPPQLSSTLKCNIDGNGNRNIKK